MSFFYRFVRCLVWIYFKLFHRVRIVNAKNFELIGDRGCLVASNHVSFFDPPLLSLVPRSALHFLARKTLWDTAWAAWLFPRLNAIPVDQEGSDMTALKKIIRLVQDGGRVVIFPEGQRSMDGKMLPGEPGVGLVLAKTKAPVVPVRISGAYESWPRSQKLPKLFKRITLVVGEPLEFKDDLGKGKEAYTAYSQRVMDAIAAI
ncbi:MAG: lysophospholipid acyltransferase family protein [Verrucomicrobiota bacterium]